MYTVFRVMLLMLCIASSNSSLAQSGDARILAARDALRSGDRVTLERLASQSDSHPLDPYVRYWLLFNKLARAEPAPAEALTDFMVQEAGSALAERLRADWLRRLAKDGDWNAFLALHADLQSPDAELRCQALNARLMTGDPGLAADIRQRWDELIDAPAACDTTLSGMVARGQVDEEAVWWRFRQQVGGRTPERAQTTLSWLDAAAASQLDQALRSPAQYLDRLPANFAITRGGRELAIAALVRLARDDRPGALARLTRLQDRLDGPGRGHLFAALAHRAALALEPEAAAWFRAAGDVPMNTDQRAWRIRTALRSGNWSAVLAYTSQLPAAEAEQPDWVYWRARALNTQGRADEAASLFQRIAGEPHFYGILAAEELGQTFAPPPHAPTLTPAQLRQAETDPGLRRALALFRLDMRTEGVREWNWSLRGQDELFRLAAARLALKHDIYDRAINTAELAAPRGAFDLRFLTPYRELIEPHVHSQGLDLSWVYGLMRQESRFVIPARSSAGAQGLMQVMPATGKWVAGKIGMRDYQPGRLSEPTTNVRLGTSYMRLILEDLDNHPVLASAGYNAGPGRAKRWRDSQPLEGAIYAETIPFDETRDYVKKVMVNTVVYAAMLDGKPQSLKSRLGTIAARPEAR